MPNRTAGTFQIGVGAVDVVQIDWDDWISDLPTGQTLDNPVVDSFDGSNGGLSVTYESVSGTVSRHHLDATAATPGFYRLKLVGTSTASPEPNYVQPRFVTIEVLERIYVEEDET